MRAGSFQRASGHINFSGINEVDILGCDEAICFLLDCRIGELQHTFQFGKKMQHAFLHKQYIVVVKELTYTITRIEVWDTTTGAELHQTDITLPSSLAIYLQVQALSHDGMLAISFYQWSDASSDLQWTPVYIYDIATLDRNAILDAHTDAVIGLAFDPTGKHLFTRSEDETFKIWQMEK